MGTIGRRAFLGVAGLGAAAATVGSSHDAEGATAYGRLTRQIVVVVRPQGTKRLEFFTYAFFDRFEETAGEIFGGRGRLRHVLGKDEHLRS